MLPTFTTFGQLIVGIKRKLSLHSCGTNDPLAEGVLVLVVVVGGLVKVGGVDTEMYRTGHPHA